ncbi:hypothetical protein ACJX0J_030912, partial [Zea mays]
FFLDSWPLDGYGSPFLNQGLDSFVYPTFIGWYINGHVVTKISLTLFSIFLRDFLSPFPDLTNLAHYRCMVHPMGSLKLLLALVLYITEEEEDEEDWQPHHLDYNFPLVPNFALDTAYVSSWDFPRSFATFSGMIALLVLAAFLLTAHEKLGQV